MFRCYLLLVIMLILGCGYLYPNELPTLDQIAAKQLKLWQTATTTPHIADCREIETRIPERTTLTEKIMRNGLDGDKFVSRLEFVTYDFGKSIKVPDSIAYGKNNFYSFNLSKKMDTANWLLTSQIHLANEPVPANFKPVKYYPEVMLHFQHLTFINRPLYSFINLPEFACKKMENVTKDDKEHIRIYFDFFTFRSQTGGKPYDLSQSYNGWFDVDPTLSYSIVETNYSYELKLKDEVAAASEQHYKYECEIQEGMPILRSLKGPFKYKNKGLPDHQGEHSFTANVVYGPVPEEEFRLTAFGLPEPVGLEIESTLSTYHYLLMSAGLLAAISVLSRFILRRRLAASKKGD